jgi:outer membrane immunogenic protein
MGIRGIEMKKLLLASVAASALTIGHSGNAADLARPVLKAPPPAPVWSWTGCFIGGQVGWGWQRNKVAQTGFNTFTSGGALFIQRFASEGSINSSGGVFGGQVGCDYQFAGGFVVGVQGTFLGSDINGLSQDPSNGVRGVITPAGGAVLPGTLGGGAISVRTRYLESVTARLGWAGWSPQTLFYVRGGGAWVDTQLDMRSSALGFFSGGGGQPGLFPSSPIFDTKYSGWTVGGGFEWMIANNWSAFVEYNFYDFKNKALTAFGGTPRIGAGTGVNVFGRTLGSDLTISTVTVGVNYRFNSWAGPVAARY